MAVTYTFASASAPIPLSQLDSNFATPITLGNTAIQLGNTVTTLNNMTFANATVSSGNVTATTVTATTVTSPAATALTIQSAGTTAMTIDTSQNVGIGTASPYGELDVTRSKAGAATNLYVKNPDNTGGAAVRVNSQTDAHQAVLGITDAGGGGRVGTITNDYFYFVTNNTERARIDSSGNFLVGTTDAGVTTGVGIKSIASSTVPQFAVVVNQAGSAAGISLYNTNAGAYRFYVTNAGVINATSTTISAISDQRLKENVRDLDLGLNAIMAVKPRRFDWKEGKGLNKKDDVGFIAQEFETVFPNSVSTSLAGEDGIEYKSVNHSELIPTLVKAIQEQQALITQLTERISALEGKA